MAKPIFFSGTRSHSKEWCDKHGQCKHFITLLEYNFEKHEAYFQIVCEHCWDKEGTTILYPTFYAKLEWWKKYCRDLQDEFTLPIQDNRTN